MSRRQLCDADLATIDYGYWHGVSPTEVAGVIGCDRGYVYGRYRRLRERHDAEGRGFRSPCGHRTPEAVVRRSVERYLGGERAADIARDVGCSTNRIWVWARQYGWEAE